MEQQQLDFLSKKLKEQIDYNDAEHFKDDEPRWHLGASQIGADCMRQVAYSFRWMAVENNISGRVHRLFNRGHIEEKRIDDSLRRSGWTVHVPTEETKEQFRYSAVMGFYGGEADGVASHPDYMNGQWLLVEKKTHNTKSFSNLVSKGLETAKPVHFAQMSCYGKALGLEYGLYYPVNKNDDDIEPKFIKLDRQLAEQMEAKAHHVITTESLPRKIKGNSETFYVCKMCPAYGICQKGAKVPVNCRSCKNGKAAENGQWYCKLFEGIIPSREFVAKGCDKWEQFE